MRLRFRNARLVDAHLDELGDLTMAGGRIVSIGPRGDEAESAPAGRASAEGRGPLVDIDCGAGAMGRPLVLMPAFVDLHVHFRDPGFPDKENLESGLLAAAAGGYGTVAAMANTRPVTDDPSRALALRSRAGAIGLADYFPVLAMTRGLEGKDISHLDDLAALGVGKAASATGRHEAESARYAIRMISDDGRDLASDEVMLAAMRRAGALGLTVVCHCEIAPASPPRGDDPEAWYSSAEGMAADRGAEIRGVERALRLALEAGCALHLCHLSTRESLDLVREAKSRPDHRVSCEATPHHLALGAGVALAAGAAGRGRVNPWL
ncbi:MAG TPA: amidohydrolase family protein, partial [Rectinemataceae bacterium]|nr:amidohydrolase family protein [Rectinemataceae bacterium]